MEWNLALSVIPLFMSRLISCLRWSARRATINSTQSAWLNGSSRLERVSVFFASRTGEGFESTSKWSSCAMIVKFWLESRLSMEVKFWIMRLHKIRKIHPFISPCMMGAQANHNSLTSIFSLWMWLLGMLYVVLIQGFEVCLENYLFPVVSQELLPYKQPLPCSN